jgi:hypothetical protein
LLSTFLAPWKGEFARKKDPDAVCEGSPEQDPVCVQTLEERGETKVTGSRMNFLHLHHPDIEDGARSDALW